jgi:hypothetical protein
MRMRLSEGHREWLNLPRAILAVEEANYFSLIIVVSLPAVLL